MTIDEAIAKNKGALAFPSSVSLQEEWIRQAIQLGIEALELIQNVKRQKEGYLNPLASYLLPSETEGEK